MTKYQQEKIKNAVRYAIERAKSDRTLSEKSLLGLMDWSNQNEGAKEVFEQDERSTEKIVSDLMSYIEGYLAK
jgi:hypothetical protein